MTRLSSQVRQDIKDQRIEFLNEVEVIKIQDLKELKIKKKA